MGGAIVGQFLQRKARIAGRVQAVALDSPAISFGAVIDHLATEAADPCPALVAWIAAKRSCAFRTDRCPSLGRG